MNENTTKLRRLLGAWSPNSIRFTPAQHAVVNEIRTHFHETGEEPDVDDYDEDECIREDIACIEQVLEETR